MYHCFIASVCNYKIMKVSFWITPLVGVTAAWSMLASGQTTPAGAAPSLATTTVQAAVGAGELLFDGRVEAIRQAALAAQVPGQVLALAVRAGDTVRAGQVLIRLDARSAEQGAAASTAQVEAARASLDVATQELARKRQLAQKSYISQAALEQAESQFKATQAQVNALIAQASASRTQAGLHVLTAPFNGVVAQVHTELGDLAMPGKPLITLFAPEGLRVSAHVPVSALSSGTAGVGVLLQRGGGRLEPVRVQMLPTVDAQSLTREVRAELPVGAVAVPGQYAQLMLPAARSATAAASVTIPVSALVRRAGLTAVYVLQDKQQPVLRLVRLGREDAGRVEVLSGLDAGERLVLEPQAAARLTNSVR